MNGYWMTAILAALAAVCLMAMAMLLSGYAHAQQRQQIPCGERAKIVAHLAQRYKEAPRAMAITGGNSFFEIFVSPSGTWTSMVTSPGGTTCIVGSGEGWEDIAIKPAGTSL